MTRRLAMASLIVLACSASGASAQEPPKPVVPAKPAITAVMVDVTLARYLGERKLSGTPYSIAVVPTIGRPAHGRRRAGANRHVYSGAER